MVDAQKTCNEKKICAASKQRSVNLPAQAHSSNYFLSKRNTSTSDTIAKCSIFRYQQAVTGNCNHSTGGLRCGADILRYSKQIKLPPRKRWFRNNQIEAHQNQFFMDTHTTEDVQLLHNRFTFVRFLPQLTLSTKSSTSPNCSTQPHPTLQTISSSQALCWHRGSTQILATQNSETRKSR